MRGGSQMPALGEPRVPPLAESAWSAAHHDIVARFSRRGGVSNQLATLLNVPQLAEAVLPMTVYITEDSTLSPRHRMLLILRTAWLAHSSPLWATHAIDSGVSADELREIARGPVAGGWDNHERSLLRLADELVLTSAVTDQTWTELGASYGPTQLMDAVETVAHITVLSSTFNAFGVQPDMHAVEPIPTGASSGAHAPNREPPLDAARIDPVDGDAIAVLRTFARHPLMAAARRPRSDYIIHLSPLTPHDRETLILRIGWNCQSEYEWAKHVGSVGRARDHGVDPAAVAAGPDASGSTDRDAILLRVADDIHRDATVSDATWAALIEMYDLASAVSAVFTVSSYRATSMSLNAYGVQLEPGDEGFPTASVSPRGP